MKFWSFSRVHHGSDAIDKEISESAPFLQPVDHLAKVNGISSLLRFPSILSHLFFCDTHSDFGKKTRKVARCVDFVFVLSLCALQQLSLMILFVYELVLPNSNSFFQHPLSLAGRRAEAARLMAEMPAKQDDPYNIERSIVSI